jgi:hypothetical protein
MTKIEDTETMQSNADILTYGTEIENKDFSALESNDGDEVIE